MSAYVSIPKLKTQIRSAEASEEGVWRQLAEAASRIFDRAAEVKLGYFSQAGNTATDKTFFGDGTRFVSLDPYIPGSITSVTLQGVAMETTDYVEAGEPGSQVLRLTQFFDDNFSYYASNWDYETHRYFYTPEYLKRHWGMNTSIVVTANWGWAAVPADIEQAVIEIAAHLFRTTDPAMNRISGTEAATGKVDAIPDLAKMTAESYRKQFSKFSLFC